MSLSDASIRGAWYENKKQAAQLGIGGRGRTRRAAVRRALDERSVALGLVPVEPSTVGEAVLVPGDAWSTRLRRIEDLAMALQATDS